MNANSSFREFARKLGAALVFCALGANAHGAATALGTEPFTLSGRVSALPNVMFVLDDSGSMKGDYLPDWAGPYFAANNVTVIPGPYLDLDGVTVITPPPPHRFFNGVYNGVAYNPGTYYRPPKMYDNTGALDTTTYPGMSGQSVATGGDATATAGSPNWRAVKVDGYGIQSVATRNLEGNAYSYTTVAGEYCTSGQLRSCTASATPTGLYTFPAKLRWCTTSTKATDTTTDAGTSCQASNIADTAANTAAGVAPYTFARMPRPRTATITVTGTGSVTGITVDGLQILASTGAGATSTDVATALAANINACTLGTTGACAVVGYSASSAANVVTVAAPGAITSTPVLTGGSATAFSGGNVPGSSLFTVITSSVSSYAYPGTAAKASKRTDCAGATCTYAEEMTNYANWHAYYRTRMQMMKTASSIAFSSVDDKFRVGYSTINNGAGSDFINVSAFDGAQKYRWYTKFLGAVPFGQTPLREALANTGRLYAGQLSILHGVAVTDPMQYSCQQNFTILSTDGYWKQAYVNNDETQPAIMPKQIDGSTDIGQQDNNDPRPYYDGGTQTRTLSQTLFSEQQLGINTFLVESRTQQQQTTTSRLTQSVITTDTYPWTKQTTTLQTRTTPLNRSAYNLESRTYPLIASTSQLQQSRYQIQSTTWPLQSYTYQLTKTTTPLQDKQFNITSVTTPLQDKQFNITSVTTPLQDKQFNITSVTTPLQDKQFNITSVTTPLQDKQFNITSVTTPLQSSTYKLQSSTRQLQKLEETSVDGGDTWQSTGWVDVSSCTTRASGPGYTRNTTCRYNTAVVQSNQNSCTTVAQSPSSPYTVAQGVTCAYETTPTVATVTSCTTVAQSGTSPYLPSTSCAYTGTPVTLTNETACTAVAASAGPTNYTGPKRTCTFNAAAASTTNVTSCTAVTPANAATPKHTCTYTGTPVSLTNETTCTRVVASTANPYTGPSRTCTHNAAAASTTDVTSCTAVTPTNAATPKHTCTYTGTPVSLSNETTCTRVVASTANPYTGPSRTCTHNAAAASTTNVTSCTAVTPANAATPKHTCTYTGTPVTLTNETTCTAVAASAGPTNYTGPQRTCTFNAAAASTTNVTSCTAVTPANAATPKHTCTYTGTAVSLTNETTCTAVAASAGPTNYTGPQRTCTFNAAAATTTNVTSCTAVTPTNAATPKHTCTYTGTPVSLTNQTSCTAVAQSTANPYTGPAVACTYQAAVIATNLTTCTAGAASAGPVFSSYQTCGYVAGAVTANLNSCTVVAQSPGPTNYTGPANACAYQGTPTITNVASCTAVAASGTFAAPRVTCTYAAPVVTTNQSTCTNAAQSAGNPYSGPAVSCAYDTIASATNLNAGTCTANQQTASPYTGPAVDCVYNGTPVVTNNVGTCTNVAQSSAPNFTGPAVTCAYGTTTGWANATATCNYVAQSAGPSFVGPARDCAYTSPSVDTLVGTCTVAPQSTGPAYTQLVANGCLAGSFPVVGAAVVTTVDSCSTAPTSGGSPIVTSTATTCAYQPVVTVNTATCTPAAVSASSPYTTAVTCPVSDTGYVPVAPTCTPAGTPPLGFDGTGKVVECRTIDTTSHPADYPSGPAPVASCTAGTDATTKVQTQCTLLIDTPPTPVDPTTCVPTVGLPVGPSFVKTICTTSSPTATVMGCAAQAPTSPLWQTVTCADDGTGTVNTLADVAAYYYKTDLRTSALGNCSGAIVPPATTASVLCSAIDDARPPADGGPKMNNVPTTAKDPLATQHMTTFTLGLGASGYMKYSDTYLTDTSGDFFTVKGVAPYLPDNGITADPANGVCSWQSIDLCNWPAPVSDQQTTIDDLWHAGVNGHGAYFSATDPNTLGASISGALDNIAGAGGASASPTISNPSLTPGDSYIFSSTFTTKDWTGELVRRQLNPVTGAVSASNDWAVQGKLDAKPYASRAIWTFDSSVATTKLKAFTSANFDTNTDFLSPHISTSPTGLTQFLCASADTCLSATNQDATHAAGASLVNYLRGDRTNEGTETDNTKYYRQRQHVLGDVVNAQVVYVNLPLYNYADAGYSAFVIGQALRQPIVYAGSNDGMLHAFHAKGSAATEAAVDASAAATNAAVLAPGNPDLATTAAAAAAAAIAAVAADAVIGQELWAYIPSMVIPNLYKLADKKYKDKHRYYVDGTPIIGDICISDCNLSTAVWKTILVGGLARGGRGYYALDVTVPASPKALWEFTDANLGYSYGNPQIAKLSDGTWVVLVTSGYNNIPNDDGAGGDGVGRLYVLDAATGTPIRSISTGVGDTTDPSGLAKITAQVANPNSDNTIGAVYGGDLYGNLWRFDVNNTVGATGFDAQLLAVLRDGTGNLQAITTKPQVSSIPTTGEKIVFVGTGGYLAASDADNINQQSLYAIRDPRATGTTPGTPIFDNPGGSPRVAGTSTVGFVRQIHTATLCPDGTLLSICAPGETVRTSTDLPVDFATQNGWFVDLAGTSERANTDPALALGALVFNTNIPSLLACDIGGTSYQYYLNYLTGGPIGGDSSTSLVHRVVGRYLAREIASSVTLAVTKEGKLISITGLSGGGIKKTEPPLPPGASITRRTSWRELIRE